MENQQFHIDIDSIPHAINVVADWLNEEIRKGLVQLGYQDISVKQSPLLRLVAHYDGHISMTALAQISQRSKPLTTQLVSGLERSGYLYRYRSEEDKRMILVGITPKGLEAHRAVAEMVNRIVAERFQEFTREELHILALLLNKTAQIVQCIPDLEEPHTLSADSPV